MTKEGRGNNVQRRRTHNAFLFHRVQSGRVKDNDRDGGEQEELVDQEEKVKEKRKRDSDRQRQRHRGKERGGKNKRREGNKVRVGK